VGVVFFFWFGVHGVLGGEVGSSSLRLIVVLSSSHPSSIDGTQKNPPTRKIFVAV
jgi:hypothetical protein